MKAYIYYFEEDNVDERGFKEEKGRIYCWSKEKLASPSIYLEVDEDILSKLEDYRIIESKLVFDEELSKQNKEKKLRVLRTPLLDAFDIYNLNVSRGITPETKKQKEKIIKWYQLLLDLNEEAIKNPPIEITYFLS